MKRTLSICNSSTGSLHLKRLTTRFLESCNSSEALEDATQEGILAPPRLLLFSRRISPHVHNDSRQFMLVKYSSPPH
jgi:hypothetical protein